MLQAREQEAEARLEMEAAKKLQQQAKADSKLAQSKEAKAREVTSMVEKREAEVGVGNQYHVFAVHIFKFASGAKLQSEFWYYCNALCS